MPDRDHVERFLILWEVEHLDYLIVVERADRYCSQTERYRLQEEILGGVTNLDLHMTVRNIMSLPTFP